MESKSSISFEAAVASALGIAFGLAAAWLVYSLHLPNRDSKWGLAPTAVSFLVFGAIAAVRLTNVDAPIWKVVVAVLAGLVAVITIGSILIIMIGCRYDACINL